MIEPERLSRALALAGANLGRSVVSVVPNAAARGAAKHPGAHTFGVKNTAALAPALVARLADDPDFLLLTVDKMADLGRSVDTDLVNPLTYRPMTGSTSGGPINILKGINDICLGTDGGGSVLAPALACSLFSVLAKGLGLQAGAGRSTDGLAFTGGVGVIGRTLPETLRAAELLCGETLAGAEPVGEIAIPAPGCMPLPGGGEENAALRALLGPLAAGLALREIRYTGVYDRPALVEQLGALLHDHPNRLYLSLEGPIDLYGADETIPRAFGGPGPGQVCGAPGKAFCKAANLCGCSAFTVPTGELATGFVILCPPGLGPARRGAALAARLAALSPRPELFERYFIRREKYCEPWHG